MMSFFTFAGITAMLVIEGWLLCSILIPASQKFLRLSLALPLSALTNVLLVFAYTITHVPLGIVSILTGHGIFIAVFGVIFLRSRERELIPPRRSDPGIASTGSAFSVLLGIACSLILLASLIYSFSHAILLPSFQYDSATNWTMRSKISWTDEQMAFDGDESRGMAKPQYPFLFHALQVTANAGQSEWSDRSANAILYLFSLSSLAALFLLLARITGALQALVGTTLIVGIPLFGVHLAQGYGDITLMHFLSLCLACLLLAVESKQQRLLTLSAVFVSAAVWTKSEGLFFGLVPWMVLVVWSSFKSAAGGHDPQLRSERRTTLWNTLLAWALSLPWLLFAYAKGLALTPHSSDTRFAFHPEGFWELWPALFSRGSFGILWYVVPLCSLLLFFAALRKHPSVRASIAFTLFWGAIVFFENLFIYLFTPNVAFLLNAEAFYRQMLAPAVLLITSCVAIYKASSGKR